MASDPDIHALLEQAQQALCEAGAHEVAASLYVKGVDGMDVIVIPALAVLNREEQVIIHRAVSLIRVHYGWAQWCFECWLAKSLNWSRLGETKGACPHGDL